MTGDIVAIRIAPEGWYAEIEIEGFTLGAVYDFALRDGTVPTGRTPYFTVVSEGFDPAGQPVTVTRTIFATIQQRKPTPDEDENEENVVGGRLVFQAVLSEFIYNDDKNGGAGTSGTDPLFHAPEGWVYSGGTPSREAVAMPVVNLSERDYPVPVANWTRSDHERLAAFSVTTAALGFHASGRGQRPLACMEFIATSGGHRTSAIVAEPMIDAALADAHPVIEYVATLDLGGFTDNALVAVNFRAYPIIGDMDSVYDSTAGSATAAVNHFTFPQSYLLDVAGVRGYPVAVVNPASGGPAGQVSGEDDEAGRAAAAAAPFATAAQAMAALSTYLAAYHGRTWISGATVYLASGQHPMSGGSEADAVPATDGGCWLTIKPLPGVSDAVLVPDPGNRSRVAAHAIKFERCTLVRGADKPFATGNNGRLLTLDCQMRDTRANTSTDLIFDNPGRQWHVRSRFNRVQTNTSYFRGCSFPEGNQIGRRCFIVGCDWEPLGDPLKLFSSSTNPTNTSDGMIMAFNAFWNCNEGVAEYPGISEGTFLQGCAVVQNLFEQAAGDGNRLIRLAADGNRNVTYNCVVAHNTVVGELCNVFYNDERTVRHVHLGHVLVLNAVRSLGSKSDNIAGDSRATGNWSVYNGCGLQGNRVQGGNFPTRFRGIHSRAGSGDPGDGTFLDLGYTDDASDSGTQLGHGNYRPAPGSILIAVDGPQMLRWDLDGNERSAPDAAGAYRYDPSLHPPAAPTALRLTPHEMILAEDFEEPGEPAGWSHDASGYNYDHAVDPLRGSQSLLITGSSTSDILRGVYTPVLQGFPPFGQIWSAYLIVRMRVAPAGAASPFLEIRRAMDRQVQNLLVIGTDRRLRAINPLGIGSSGSHPLAVGVETHLWLRRNADGSLSCWAADTATKPEQVTFSATGANLGQSGSLHLGGARSLEIMIDRLRIQTGEIGSDADDESGGET